VRKIAVEIVANVAELIIFSAMLTVWIMTIGMRKIFKEGE